MTRLTVHVLFFLLNGLFAAYPLQADTMPAKQEQVLAPGYGSLQFSAPEPGTYLLPALGAAADGKVLDNEGKATTLYKPDGR